MIGQVRSPLNECCILLSYNGVTELESNIRLQSPSGCRNGQFHFDAWVDAQGDFGQVKFQDFLLSRDRTGIAFRKPVKVLPIDRTEPGRPRERFEPIFALSVSGEGIGGLVNAF